MRAENKAVKFLVAAASVILLSAMVISFLPVRGEEKIYGDVIRLHVIANSDSDYDQALKLKVRDAVLKTVSSYPAPADTSEAYCAIEEHRADIKESAASVLRECGSDDGVEVYFDKETYPVRYYDGFRLPAGEYTSLRVVIGEGGGHNWWCVLFPPLCTAASEKEREDDFLAAGFTTEQYRLIENSSGSKYKVRFKILEILSEVFGFDY